VSFVRSWFRCTALLAALAFAPAQAATVTVTTTADVAADDGQCTLREAIVATNSNLPSGALAGECVAGEAPLDTIYFAIPGAGPHTIFVGNALPVITAPLFIDGWSQPGTQVNTIQDLQGWNAVHMVRIDGSQSSMASKPGLSLLGPGASGSIIRGLEIANFVSAGCCADNGIYLAGATQDVEILGNLIHAHQSRGILTLGQGSNHGNLRIGKPGAANRNVIHSNDGAGISLNNCTGCLVENNWLGVRLDQGVAKAGGNQIGVDLNAVTQGSVVRNNWIGGNFQAGVGIRSVTSAVEVHDNLIGAGVPNLRGITVSNINDSVPTDATIRDNTISGNTQVGVAVVNFKAGNAVQRHVLRGNRLFANGGLELDLGAPGGDADGVTPNDAGDADLGPNGLQNHPVLGAPLQNGILIDIPYVLSSPDAMYALEFSFSSACDASGHGPAGSMPVAPVRVTGLGTSATVSVQPDAVPASGFVSATATGPEGTSEFSACVPYQYAFQEQVFASGFE
jgi:CSLREA domain-containing protein